MLSIKALLPFEELDSITYKIDLFVNVEILYIFATAKKRSVYDQYGKEGLKAGAQGGRGGGKRGYLVDLCLYIRYLCIILLYTI